MKQEGCTYTLERPGALLGRPFDTIAVGLFDLVVIGMTGNHDRTSAQDPETEIGSMTDFLDLAIALRTCCCLLASSNSVTSEASPVAEELCS